MVGLSMGDWLAAALLRMMVVGVSCVRIWWGLRDHGVLGVDPSVLGVVLVNFCTEVGIPGVLRCGEGGEILI